jgi:glycerophosphoryl diester phosphodiesterase
MRVDELPKSVKSADELLDLLFNQARVDGLFSDFPDVGIQWLKLNLE